MVTQGIIQVRDTKPKDLPVIHEIAKDSFNDPYPLRLLKHIYNTEPEAFLTAEKNGKVVGYLISMVRWGDTGHILAVAVGENHRREGVGTALITKSIERLRRNGANQIKLEVRISNEGAQEFYGKIGFNPSRVVPEYYSDGEDAITMKYEC